MQAVRVTEHGGPLDALRVEDVPVPEPGVGEVLVAVSAASLNFGDLARCRGTVASVMGQVPFTLGMDVCGTVTAVGDGADPDLVGTRVVGMAQQSLGGIAEYAVCSANGTFPAPAELDDVEAAAFTLPFHVAHLALHRRARLIAGETLLVVGGASAVGTAMIQLGRAAGATVLAVAGGPGKVALCDRLGAVGLDHTTFAPGDDLFDRVMARTDGRGAEVVVDLVGGDGTETVWSCVAREGRYVPVGFNDDPEAGLTGRPLRKVCTGNFSVVGVILAYNDLPVEFRRFGLATFPPEVGRETHAALCDLVTAGAVRPVVGRVVTMEGVAAALDDHEQRRTSGRTVVDVAGSRA